MRSLTSPISVGIFALLCAGAITLNIDVLPASAQSASHAGASDYISPLTRQYLALRKAYPPHPGLTLKSLGENPASYRGKTLEINGLLTGTCSAEEGLTRLMLSTDSVGTISLTMNQLPEWVHSGERLRVLVVVTGSDDPNAVEYGIPEMEVIAVTSAGELATIEEHARQKKAAELAAADARRASVAAANARRSAISLASRSSYRTDRVSYPSQGGGGLSSAAQAVYPAYRDFIWNCNRRLTSQQATDITWAVLRYSEALDTDPRLVIALIIAESDFDPRSTSHAGAMGLGQLMPETIREISAKTGMKQDLINPYDPVQNVAGSVWLLRTHLAQYSGGKAMSDLNMDHIALALAAYNAGPGAVKKYGGIPPYRETQNYVRRVSAIYKQLCGKTG